MSSSLFVYFFLVFIPFSLQSVQDCDDPYQLEAPILIFSSFKPCPKGSPEYIIQRNALYSWKNLKPKCHVAVFGDEDGVAELAKEFDVIHVPEIKRGESNLPLVNELFAAAAELGDQLNAEMIMYTNGDMVFTDELPKTVMHAFDDLKRGNRREVVVYGKRYSSNVFEGKLIESDWQEKVREAVSLVDYDLNHNNGRWAIDYFAFTTGAFGKLPEQVPPFLLGVMVFDNWLVHLVNTKAAGFDDIFVLEASRSIPALHQYHPPTQFTEEKKKLKEYNAGLAKKWFNGRVDASSFVIQPCTDKSHFKYKELPKLCVIRRSLLKN